MCERIPQSIKAVLPLLSSFGGIFFLGLHERISLRASRPGGKKSRTVESIDEGRANEPQIYYFFSEIKSADDCCLIQTDLKHSIEILLTIDGARIGCV